MTGFVDGEVICSSRRHDSFILPVCVISMRTLSHCAHQLLYLVKLSDFGLGYLTCIKSMFTFVISEWYIIPKKKKIELPV